MNKAKSDTEQLFYEMPKDKIIKFGANELSTQELLAVLIADNKINNALKNSYKLLSEFEDINGVFDASFEEMKNLGITEMKASKILAAAELLRRVNSYRTLKKQIKITCPKEAADVVMNEMISLKQEILKVVFLNTKNIIIGSQTIFKGSLNNSIVHPREIFKPAINKSSASIIIYHNHPSGDPSPSSEDINITLRIKECGSILGIKLLDHIIIGNNNFISFKDRKLI